MPNQLKMSKIQSIIALRQQGWSFTRIARELGIHRQTVADHVREHSKPTEAPTGSEEPKPTGAPTGPDDSKPTEAPRNSLSGGSGRSDCAPFREMIESKLGQGLHARRIYQDLVAEKGFAGSYWSVMRFVRRLGRTRELPFRRMECEPGEEAQVDFGSGAPVVDRNGRRRKTHVFRIVLSHSRKGYSEAVFRQTTEEFIRCLENAFHHFGGSVKTLVIDNLRAAVSRGDDQLLGSRSIDLPVARSAFCCQLSGGSEGGGQLIENLISDRTQPKPEELASQVATGGEVLLNGG